jgi:hypothetical protein
MTTTHILNLVLAISIVSGLAAVCRVAFLVAGHLPASTEQRAGERRLAA